ncbi:MAG: alpha/beta hydrolase [Candidatus Eisenbacteria bacterium]
MSAPPSHVIRPPHGGSFPVTDVGPDLGGPEATTPLVLVPGIGGPRDTYHHQVAAFRDRRRVIATNLNATRGKGMSALDSAARDVLAAMDALAIERADVLGASFGSVVTARVAMLAPERVRRMVWVAPPVVRHGPWRSIFGPGWLVGGALLRYSPARYHAPVARFVSERRMYTPEPELSPRELELLAQRVSDTQWAPFFERLVELRGWDWQRLPSPIAHPVLVMQGRSERALTPPEVFAAWEQLSGREVAVTPGHHMPYLSYPDEFNRSLGDFLDAPAEAPDHKAFNRN